MSIFKGCGGGLESNNRFVDLEALAIPILGNGASVDTGRSFRCDFSSSVSLVEELFGPGGVTVPWFLEQS